MKKIYIHIMMLAAMVVAGAAMTSCQKEEAATGKFSMTVNATKGGGNAKALSEDDHTINATWTVGERVTVYNITKGEPLEGYLEAQSAGASTTLNGTVTGTIAVGDSLLLKFLSPDYDSQDGTLAYIAAHCDYAEARVKVSDNSGSNVRITAAANFVNQQAIVKFTLKNTSDAAISVTPLKVSDGTHTYTVTPASATSEIYVAMPSFSGGTVSITAFDGDDTYFYRKTDVTFTKGQYYEISVKMAKAEYVDLGLPSGTKWATFNLGATKPEEYGDYYAWGATETWYSRLSPELTWKTGKEGGYTVGNVPSDNWTKYNTATYLQPDDDAAYANWGSNWCMPTMEQWQELFENCTCVESTRNGVSGYLVTSNKNSNTIFLPSTGHWDGTTLNNGALYFTATTAYLESNLYAMFASPAAKAVYHTGRQLGMSVRPVKSGNRIYNYTFYYTGAAQAFTVPETGYYTLECYGAQGGSFVDKRGGYGGTSQLTYHLTQGTTLYIYVGGQGGSKSSGTGQPEGGAGGWNGGGKGGTGVAHWSGGDPYNGGSGGGGATHIATSAIGAITSSTSFSTNNANLLLIAGGGGGACNYAIGANGGGAEGGKGSRGETAWTIDWNNGTYSCGRDGEVSANGAQSCEGCGGGGGGYVGGNTWHFTSSNAEYQSYSGAGGSSWGNTTNGMGYSTTAGGATAGGNGKAVVKWHGTTYSAK